MNRLGFRILILWIALFQLAPAGVVEDAEAELRVLKLKQAEVENRKGGVEHVPSPLSVKSSSASGAESMERLEEQQGRRSRPRPEHETSTRKQTPPIRTSLETEPEVKVDYRSRATGTFEPSFQEAATFSIVAVLFLVLLIAALSYWARKVFPNR